VTGRLAGLAVTVVGIYYAPDCTGIAPYTTDLCETLVTHGAAVHAVVGIPHYPQWTADRRYRSRLRYDEELGGVRVSRVRHFVPRSQDVVRRGLYELTFLLGSRTAVRGHRPDLVLGVTPSLAGAAAAAALAARRGVPLGLVVQDLVGKAAGQSGIRGGGRLAARVSELEAGVLRRAALVGCISDSFRPSLLAMGLPAERVRPLPNYTRLATTDTGRDEARRLLGWPADRRIVLHTGNMGLKQDLGNVVRAAGLGRDRGRDDLLFILLGDGNDRPAVQRLAGGTANVRFVEPVPDQLYPLALAAADCLLLNERRSVRDMCLPSKLTSYLAAGRPIVAATAAAGEAARQVLAAGAGLVVPPARPDQLLDAVVRVVDDPAGGAAYGTAGQRYAALHLSVEAGRHRIVRFTAELGRIPAQAAEAGFRA
jgi:glycosyltransferase involved in cell wall biosynthesis